MKIEWLNINVTAISSPAEAEREICQVILSVFWPVRAAIVVGEPLCGLEIPSWGLKSYSELFDKNRVVGVVHMALQQSP